MTPRLHSILLSTHMKTRLAKLLLGSLFASSLPISVSHGAVTLAPDGIDLQGTGLILNSPTINSPDSVTSTGTSWEFSPVMQGSIVPAGQLTGLTTAGTAVNYEDLLPLRASKIRVMTGVTGAAPTGVGTVIDSAGIDTNSLITDALYVTDSVTQQIRQFTLSNGVLTLPGTIRIGTGGTMSSSLPGAITLGGDYGTQATNYKAVAIGGQNNTAAGDSSTVIGGQDNQATSTAVRSIVVGGRANTIKCIEGAIIGGLGCSIQGSSPYAVIAGGGGNVMGSSVGSYNGLFAGSDNQFVSGSECSVILGGLHHRITNGSYGQAIIGGNALAIGNAPYAVMLGGQSSTIQGSAAGTDSGSAIIGGGWHSIAAGVQYAAIVGGHQNSTSGTDAALLGGALNTIAAGSQGSAILGGFYNNNAGNRSALVAAHYSEIVSGTATLAAGWRSKAQGSCQVVFGRANLQNDADAAGGKVFIIGNGTSDTARSNAFSVDWTGKVETNSVQASGKVNATQGGRFDDTVRIAPRGGLSMGTFTYEP